MTTTNPWRQRLYHLLLWVVALVFFSPVLWIFLSAFKSAGEIISPNPVFIFRPTMDNILRVVREPLLGRDVDLPSDLEPAVALA